MVPGLGGLPDPLAVAIIGTRPEAIKLAPVVLALRRSGMRVLVLSTGQHPDMVDPVLALFEIRRDLTLDIRGVPGDLNALLANGIIAIAEALRGLAPQAVIVQGDTTSALAGAIAAYQDRLPVAHVEAGLRSHDLNLPFPEEMNRRLIGILARWHFAPTRLAAEQLAAEGAPGMVSETGNTVVDAVEYILARGPGRVPQGTPEAPFILATAHRRESWGEPIRQVALGLRDVLRSRPGLSLLFATHPNPLARDPVTEVLGGEPRATVVGPMAYDEFLHVMQQAELVITDSGGIQEEGPTLGVPVLVTRAVTERPEGVLAGAVEVIGTDRRHVRQAVDRLLADERARREMSSLGRTLYGDGRASERIAAILLEALSGSAVS